MDDVKGGKGARTHDTLSDHALVEAQTLLSES